jgi:antitoxin component YwqK of YwqJK toxin-antitoxin module
MKILDANGNHTGEWLQAERYIRRNSEGNLEQYVIVHGFTDWVRNSQKPGNISPEDFQEYLQQSLNAAITQMYTGGVVAGMARILSLVQERSDANQNDGVPGRFLRPNEDFVVSPQEMYSLERGSWQPLAADSRKVPQEILQDPNYDPQLPQADPFPVPDGAPGPKRRAIDWEESAADPDELIAYDEDGSGGYVHVTHDQGPNEWSLSTYAADPTGQVRLESVRGLESDGAVLVSLYGYTPEGLAYLDSRDTFAANGALTKHEDWAASGAHTDTAYEHTAAHPIAYEEREYDSDGDLLHYAVQRDNGSSTRTDYDAAGRVDSVTERDSAGRIDRIALYDDAQRADRVTVYDDAGRTDSVTVYDDAGRVDAISLYSDAGLITMYYAYDDGGRIDSLQYYDTAGRIDQMNLYDDAGRLDAVYFFDDAERVDQLQSYDDAVLVDRIAYYDDAGRMDSLYIYDDALRLDELQLYDDNSLLDQLNRYDDAGRIDSIRLYDNAGRLDSATFYDDGNRVDQITLYDDANRTDSITYYDDAGRVDSLTDYDAAGTQSWASFTAYYDDSNRLTSQYGSNDNGTRWTNVYDAANSGAWNRYAYSYDASGNTLTVGVINDNDTGSIT